MISILGLGRTARRIARALRARGEPVRASHRDGHADPDADEVVAVDIDSFAGLRPASPGEKRPALDELTRGARLLIWSASRYDPELLETSSCPVLLLGSTSVYGEDAGNVVTEDTDPAPRDESGRTLLRAEDAVLRHGGTVLRLAGLYAPGRGPQTSLRKSQRLEGSGERLLNLIHEEDAARAALFAIEKNLRGVLNVSDGAPITRSAFYALAATAMGLSPPTFEGASTSRGRRVSNAKLLSLGFTLEHPDVTRERLV